MKGIIFTEFIEMMEKEYGFTITNQVIEDSKLVSEGIYTSIGTYPFPELARMVQTLASITNHNVNGLLKNFGRYLFGRFSLLHPQFILQYKGSLELLAGIEGHIHRDVRKLYENAELPYFEFTEENGHPTILYRSKRNLNYFAWGLMEGCFEHFNEHYHIEMTANGEDQWKFKLSPYAAR
jgi:hypothetical protein